MCAHNFGIVGTSAAILSNCDNRNQREFFENMPIRPRRVVVTSGDPRRGVVANTRDESITEFVNGWS